MLVNLKSHGIRLFIISAAFIAKPANKVSREQKKSKITNNYQC